MPNAAKTIRSFNAGRDPERLAMKYANLRSSPFVFFSVSLINIITVF